MGDRSSQILPDIAEFLDFGNIVGCPAKTNINVCFVALVWLRFGRDSMGIITPVY